MCYMTVGDISGFLGTNQIHTAITWHDAWAIMFHFIYQYQYFLPIISAVYSKCTKPYKAA